MLCVGLQQYVSSQARCVVEDGCVYSTVGATSYEVLQAACKERFRLA
jgi:hypothetical protein